MDVKSAVHTAKKYILDLFDEENISDLGLEEVTLDHASNTWQVTLGFSRPWDRSAMALTGHSLKFRSYKTVFIADQSGDVVSLKNRDVAA